MSKRLNLRLKKQEPEEPLADELDREYEALGETADEWGNEGKVSRLEPYIGKRGELLLSLFTVESLDQAEDHVLCAAITEDGQLLEEELAHRLLSLPAKAVSPLTVAPNNDRLRTLTEQRQIAIQKGISEKNAKYF